MYNWQNFLPMMGGYSYSGTQCAALESIVKNPLFSFMAVFYLLTWALVLAVLVALLRYLWRKGGK